MGLDIFKSRYATARGKTQPGQAMGVSEETTVIGIEPIKTRFLRAKRLIVKFANGESVIVHPNHFPADKVPVGMKVTLEWVANLAKTPLLAYREAQFGYRDAGIDLCHTVAQMGGRDVGMNVGLHPWTGSYGRFSGKFAGFSAAKRPRRLVWPYLSGKGRAPAAWRMGKGTLTISRLDS